MRLVGKPVSGIGCGTLHRDLDEVVGPCFKELSSDNAHAETICGPYSPATESSNGGRCKLAGVSGQTVSRVLNGNPNVSSELIERVGWAVQQLDYRRNTAARALSTGRSMNLGIVSFDIWQYGPAHVLFGIADAARQAGYATSLICLANNDPKSAQPLLII